MFGVTELFLGFIHDLYKSEFLIDVARSFSPKNILPEIKKQAIKNEEYASEESLRICMDNTDMATNFIKGKKKVRIVT